jgi:hypothetical protein
MTYLGPASDDQAAAIEFLADPASYGGGEVTRIDTHCSIVFLTGDRAHKTGNWRRWLRSWTGPPSAR